VTILLPFGLAFLALGLVVFGFLARSLRRAQRSRAWPHVEGRLDQASLKRVESLEAAGQGGHAATQVDYVYVYTVDGTEHRGTRVTFSDSMVKTGGALRDLQERLRVGSVPVYYDPANPSESALIPGPTLYNYTPFITAFLLIGIGVAGTFFGPQLLELAK